MRHARARLEIVVVGREAALRLLPVRLEIGVVARVEVVEVVAVPAGGGKHVIVVVVVGDRSEAKRTSISMCRCVSASCMFHP